MYIRNSIEEFQIIPWYKAQKDQEYLIFTTESSACTFLRGFIYDPYNLQCLRCFCERETHFFSYHRAGIDEMMQHLARNLYLERFYLLQHSKNEFRKICTSGSGNGGNPEPFKDPLLPLVPKKKHVPPNLPDVFQTGPVRPADPECQLILSRVACSHGRRASSEGLLEVVPAETGDVITLSAAAAGQCGDHPEWKIGGFWTSTEKGEEASFRAMSWRAGKPYWLSDFLPHVYRVSVDCCAGDDRTYEIRAYPSDQLSIKISADDWPKLKDRLEYCIEKVLGAYLTDPKFQFMEGSGSISAGWKEYEKDHRAFYQYDVAVGFNPVIGAKIRIPFGPLAAIPQWIKKYGDAYFFIEFDGGIKLNGHWGRKTPDEHNVWVDAAGYIGGKIGASLFLIDKKAVSAEASGGTGISMNGEAGRTQDKPEIKAQLTWEGIKGALTIEICWGWVEIQREFNIVDGGPMSEERHYKLPFTD